jgi:hypothetical protein
MKCDFFHNVSYFYIYVNLINASFFLRDNGVGGHMLPGATATVCRHGMDLTNEIDCKLF